MIIDWTRAHYRGGQYYAADNLWNWTAYATPLVGAPEEGNMIFAREFTDTVFARIFADTIFAREFTDVAGRR